MTTEYHIPLDYIPIHTTVLNVNCKQNEFGSLVSLFELESQNLHKVGEVLEWLERVGDTGHRQVLMK